jgi:hypothetical protein
MLAPIITPGRAFGQANDPYLGTWFWSRDYAGSYHVHFGITLSER